MVRLTATEAARSFSDVLNRVAAGEEFEVTRSGAPVASVTAVPRTVLSAERFRRLIATAPAPDEELATDLADVREGVGPPEEPAWLS